MKNILLPLVLLATLTYGCQKDDDSDTMSQPAILSEQEIQDLQFLIEEEKLARDVYLYAAEMYTANIFGNIASSEQNHMNRIQDLLITYNIDNPTTGKAEGEFGNQDLQVLYNALTASAELSLLDALIAGATIEDLDIADIEDLVVNTEKVDLLDAYSDLACGSRNHLRAFMNSILSNEGAYSPQFLSQEQFNEIVGGSHENCGQ